MYEKQFTLSMQSRGLVAKRPALFEIQYGGCLERAPSRAGLINKIFSWES